jgi:DNA-binding NarL/FixJ family response regulator
MIRILVVDEHEQVRRALEACLRATEDLQVVKSTGRYAQAVRDACTLAPEVILLETKAPDGIETLQALRTAVPQAAVIVLTSYSDSREEEAVLELGAVAYVLKTLDTHILLETIRQTAGDVLTESGSEVCEPFCSVVLQESESIHTNAAKT